MKILSKKKISMCVGAVLGTAAIAPSAYAVHFSADGLGDSLSNYYTTHNGNATLINYTNTSDRTIAMRVRIHEYRNSRSWDFTVILSPFDVWNATIADGGSQGPVIYTGDESCTIPAISRDAANPTVLATSGFLAAIAGDEGPQTTDRLKEGYVNAIVMGSKTFDEVTGRGLEPDSCAMETARFVNTAPNAWDQLLNQEPVEDPNTLNGYLTTGGYPEYTNNAIKGVFNVLNVPLGQNAAQGMDTLADFFQAGLASAPYAGAFSLATPRSNVPQYPDFATETGVPGDPPINLVTLQMHPGNIPLESGLTAEQRYLASFFLPTQASANTPAYFVVGDDAIATTRDLPRVGAEAVAFLHQATNVINMWTALQNEAAWDTATDIVIMADVKKFFVDGPETPGTNPLQGRYQWTPGIPVQVAAVAGGPSGAMQNGVSTSPFSERYDEGLSCDPISWNIWDREENWDPNTPRFSPARWGLNLCFETNVITFNGVSALRTPNGYNINTDFANGWINLSLISDANRYPGNLLGWTGSPFAGLPVASWGFTTRVADSGLNEAVSFPRDRKSVV